ncbi:YihY/virulence factor BrkB family protein [Tianweitania sediminis]|uniref:YihY/virulence factor BrkB family protein n=1 Tax=Tianweitania sediminis TaxID=1502156 RepID=A0A8J7QXM0_9HYPH|nr:YihY/virulence factor BrkB family protein [Tianweitania sediminis]MBP0437660.1 YihY/virulence factor BrkB family protein [Tianweitania sediminis]
MASSNQTNTADRGRHATSPAEVPAAGWKDILWRTYNEFSNDRVTLIAAAVTYYLLLSMFPTLAAFVSVYGLFADPATVSDHLNMLSAIVPEGGMSIIQEQVTSLASGGGTKLGFALLVSLAIALWSASSGVKTMFEAMNVAYDETEKRGYIKLSLVALAFIAAGLVGGILLIGAAVVVPILLSVIGLGSGMEWLVQIGSYVVLALILMTAIAALYRWGPSRQNAKWVWITPGAVLSVVVIIIISILFSWYAANFANYDETYGSLGGLIAMLTWMWISVTVLIGGAELNAEAERQTKVDSTTGQDDRLGQRDATAADTVGSTANNDSNGSRGGALSEHDLASKSPEWQAGYHAAMRRSRPNPPRFSLGTLALALPASLALSAVNRRRKS